MKYYRIKNWDDHFENNRTRDMEKMRWVPVPNKHDGEGFQRIMQDPDGIMIYGCWHLILQVASKLRERGTLLRDDGTPVTAEVMALKTGWRKPKDFQRAFDFCSSAQVSWLEVVNDGTAENPQVGAENPQVGARNGMEGKEEKGSPTGQDTDESFWDELAKLYTWVKLPQEKAKMQAWLLTPKGRGRKITRRFVVNWLNKLDRPMAGMTPAHGKSTLINTWHSPDGDESMMKQAREAGFE